MTGVVVPRLQKSKIGTPYYEAKTMDAFRQAYQIRKFLNEKGEPQVDFECPNCKQWSPLVQHDKIRALTFKCANVECQFEEHTSLDVYTNEDIH